MKYTAYYRVSGLVSCVFDADSPEEAMRLAESYDDVSDGYSDEDWFGVPELSKICDENGKQVDA